jgi:hypothetical protein
MKDFLDTLVFCLLVGLPYLVVSLVMFLFPFWFIYHFFIK